MLKLTQEHIGLDRAVCRHERGSWRTMASAVATIVFSAGMALSAATATAADAPTKFKFAASPTWFGQVPIMVAIDKGFFSDEGLEVEFTPILASYDRISALTSGSVDFSNLGRVAVISEMARGNEAFYFVANVDDSPGQEGCWGRPGVETVADMRGRKIAANSSAEITMTLLLASEGMTQRDIEFVNLSPSEMAAALSRGDVDAACVWQPLLDGLKEAAPDGALIGTDMDTEFYEKYGTMASPDIVIMRRELVDEHPEEAAKLVKAMFRGADFANENPEEAAEVVAHYFGRPASEIVESIKGFAYFGGDNWPEHMRLHTEQMQGLTDMLFELGKIGNQPDVEQWKAVDFIAQP